MGEYEEQNISGEVQRISKCRNDIFFSLSKSCYKSMRELNRSSMLVFLWMMDNTVFDSGKVDMSQANKEKILVDLRMNRSTYCRSINELLDNGLLLRGKDVNAYLETGLKELDVYYISPHIAWFGQSGTRQITKRRLDVVVREMERESVDKTIIIRSE